MRDNALVLLFIAIPLVIVISMTAQVPSHYSNPWQAPPATGGAQGDRFTLPDEALPVRWDAITLNGKPLDDKATGQIVVKAVFEGAEVPPQIPIDMAAFGRCVNAFPELPKARQINVAAGKSVPWAFAYVKQGLPKGLAYGAMRPRTMDQKGCIYRPHVMGLVKGQEVWIYNLEEKEAHNVLGKRDGETLFNEAQAARGVELRKTFEPGVGAVLMKCEIHPWMASRVNVLEHPYFTTTVNTYETNEEGVQTSDKIVSCQGVIKRLPPGKYTLAVWHESFSGADVTVTVEAGKTAEVTFKLK